MMCVQVGGCGHDVVQCLGMAGSILSSRTATWVIMEILHFCWARNGVLAFIECCYHLGDLNRALSIYVASINCLQPLLPVTVDSSASSHAVFC